MDPSTVRTHLPVVLARLGIESQSEPRIEAIHTGMSGASFAVDAGGLELVVRIQRRERLPLHWEQLTRLNHLAATHRIAPRVRDVDDTQRWLVSDRVHDVSMIAAIQDPRRRTEMLRRLGHKVGELHEIALPPDLEPRSVSERTRALYELVSARYELPAFARDAMEHFESLAPVPEAKQVLCHNDLNSTNIMFDGEELWFIDWETAGAGDGAFDLATLVNFLLLDGSAIEVLLEGYRQARGADLIKPWRLVRCRQLAYLCYGVAFLELVSSPPSIGNGARLSSLAECYAQLGTGALDLGSDAGRWRFAAAMFRGYEELMA